MYKQNIQNYLTRHGYTTFSPKAVLFDMDGVIYDSMPHHAFAWDKAMKEFGLSFPPEEVYANEGMRGPEAIAMRMIRQKGREATPEEIKTIYDRKSDIVVECGEIHKMPGTHELMQRLTDAGLLCLIVTGSGQPSTLNRVVADHPGLLSQEHIVSCHDCKKGKPDPEPYLIGLERAGKALGRNEALKPWEAIVVENAPMGIQAGVAANIFTIGVNTGPLPDQMLWDAGADLVLKPMTLLRDTVHHLLK